MDLRCVSRGFMGFLAFLPFRSPLAQCEPNHLTLPLFAEDSIPFFQKPCGNSVCE